MRTILFNAKVYVERGTFAEAVLVEGGIIKLVGSNKEVFQLCEEPYEKIDCMGRTLIPGLNDSHLHLIQVGEAMNQVEIAGSKSIDDMVDRCKEFMEEHPISQKEGIHALGWNQDFFEDEKRIPTRQDLDRISTKVPVVLERICGHMLSANTKAIELLGITENSPKIPGGEFYLGEDGKPNGIFTENATNKVKYLIPDFTYEQRRDMIYQVMDYAVSHGITSVQSNDVGTTLKDDKEGFRMLKEVYNSGKAKIRYRHQTCFNTVDSFREYLEGEHAHGDYSGDWLKLGPLKLFKDGSLGARTALMKNPYVDDPGNYGLVWIKDEDMREYVALAKKYGVQVVTHVIGDKAIEDTVNAYIDEGFVDGENTLRHSVIHCQITDKDLLEKIAENGICAFVQPIFLDYDMHIVEDRVGKDLASTSYAFKTLKELGVHTAYGTDAPVEDCNPFPVIYMAVTRKDKKGQPINSFYPSECVDVYDAVDAYTYESAYVEFMEDRKGRIKEGYLADMVLLDKDIFTCDPMEIKDILPIFTMVDGKIVYSR